MMLSTLRDLHQGTPGYIQIGNMLHDEWPGEEPDKEDGELEFESFPGLPMTLSKEDTERIADLVPERTLKRIEDLLNQR